jgi:hypothetical protein
VGADEVAIARDVRSQNDVTTRHTEYESFEMSDSSRIPTRGIAIASLIGAVLLLIAAGLWYGTSLFRGEESAPAPVAEQAPPPVAPVAAPTPVGAGQVTLTATDDVWVRIYDATGKTLFENTLKAGDHYDVPVDANGPMINVGRPDKLQLMVNGSAVPPLGDGSHAIQDVGISAAALAARATGTAQPAPGATPQPAATPPSRTTPRKPGESPPRAAGTPAAAPVTPVVAPPAAVPSAAATTTP